jgi:hypothetical protein
VDPRAPGADLHRRELRARLQRRPEGHRTVHADPDRRGPGDLWAEPRHLATSPAGLQAIVAASQAAQPIFGSAPLVRPTRWPIRSPTPSCHAF